MWWINLLLACSGSSPTIQTRYVMGTLFSIEVPASTDEKTIHQCFVLAQEWDRLGSIHTKDSLLTMLREGNSGAFDFPENRIADLLDVLSRAMNYMTQSDGAFHPAITHRMHPGRAELLAAIESYRRGESWSVTWDLGGILKGTAIDRMIEYLEASGVPWAVVNGGGDLRWYGASQAIVIRKPGIGLDEPLLWVQAESGAIATSANDRRFTETEGGIQGHIVRPDGFSAPTVNQVSVFAETAEKADVWATACFVAGEEKALAWAKEQGFGLVLISEGEAPVIHDESAVFVVANNWPVR